LTTLYCNIGGRNRTSATNTFIGGAYGKNLKKIFILTSPTLLPGLGLAEEGDGVVFENIRKIIELVLFLPINNQQFILEIMRSWLKND
jgi:hypothetical protein